MTSNGKRVTILQKFRDSADALAIDATYADEVGVTASLLTDTNTMLSVFIKTDFNQNPHQPSSSFNAFNPLFQYLQSNSKNPLGTDNYHTTILQFGDPAQAAQNEDYSGFEKTGTLNALAAKGLSSSLQGRILSGGGYARLYRIEDIVNCTTGAEVIQNFYNATFDDVTTCITIPDKIISSSKSESATEIATTTTTTVASVKISTDTISSSSNAGKQKENRNG